MQKIRCVDCGEVFTMTDPHIAWYESQGFVLPKRCDDCRALRRSSVPESGTHTVALNEPLYIYAKPVLPGKLVHGNAMHHILDSTGKSLCSSFRNETHYWSDVGLLRPDAQLCAKCKRKADEHGSS